MRTLPSGEAATQMTNPITTVTVTTYTQPTLAPTQPTMVSIVLAALSGAKIAHREKARIINEEIIRTCQLTLGPLRSAIDRKSTRLNSSHVSISYAVFCLRKKRL